MSLRDWLTRMLGGNAAVPRSGHIEVAVVEAWRSNLAGAALQEEGIECHVLTIGQYPASEYLRPMARLLVDVSDAARAREILSALDTEVLGDGD